MPRALQFAIFLTVVAVVLAGSHTYLWLRLVRDTQPPAPWRAIATWVLILLALSLPATFLLSRTLSPAAGKVVLFAPYVWMGALVFLMFFFALGDLVRLGVALTVKLGGWAQPLADPARRLFVARVGAAALGGLTLVLAAIGVWGALRAPVVQRLRVETPRLPAALDGTTIAQLTDLHLGPTLQREWLADVVRRTNELKPDVIVLTGDLVDGSVEQLRDIVEPIKDLKARWGVYFVTGNHEYYSGVEEWLAELPRLGVRVLHNERVSVGTPEASFDLAGRGALRLQPPFLRGRPGRRVREVRVRSRLPRRVQVARLRRDRGDGGESVLREAVRGGGAGEVVSRES